MAIVYQHKRNDTNEVFYIGIGLMDKRAYSKKDRNKHWHNIVKKVGYSIEITHRDIIWEEAGSIEKYLIAFWGRRDLGLGPLVNLTDGGEGTPNPSEETRKKISKGAEKRIGHETSIETRKKISEANKIALKGKKQSEEMIRKRVEGRKGYRHSEETISLMSESAKRYHQNMDDEQTKEKLGRCSKGGIAVNKILKKCPDCGREFNPGNYSQHINKKVPCKYINNNP